MGEYSKMETSGKQSDDIATRNVSAPNSTFGATSTAVPTSGKRNERPAYTRIRDRNKVKPHEHHPAGYRK